MADSRANDSSIAQTDKSFVLDIENVDYLLNSYIRFRSIQEVCKANEMDSTDWPDPRTVDELSSQTKIKKWFTYENVCDEIAKHFIAITEQLRCADTSKSNGVNQEATFEVSMPDRKPLVCSDLTESAHAVSEDMETSLREGKNDKVLTISDDVKVYPVVSSSEFKGNKDAISGHHGWAHHAHQENELTVDENVHDLQPKLSCLSSSMKYLKDVVVLSDLEIMAHKKEKADYNLEGNQSSTSPLHVLVEEVDNRNSEKLMDSVVKGNVPIIDISELSQIDCTETEVVNTEDRSLPNLKSRESIVTKKRSASETDCRFAEALREQLKIHNQNGSLHAVDEKQMVLGLKALYGDNKIDRNKDICPQKERSLDAPRGDNSENERDNKRPTARLTIKKRVYKQIRRAFSKTKTVKKYFKF